MSDLTGTAKVIYDFIESLPYATRMYPDAYAQRLADRLKEMNDDLDTHGR